MIRTTAFSLTLFALISEKMMYEDIVFTADSRALNLEENPRCQLVGPEAMLPHSFRVGQVDVGSALESGGGGLRETATKNLCGSRDVIDHHHAFARTAQIRQYIYS